MPKPTRRKLVERRATDHRALVLEVVATTPSAATRKAIEAEVLANRTDERFGHNQIAAMVSSLLRFGLIGRREGSTLLVTTLGLEWLQAADFTRELPAPHTKPKRQPRKK